MSSEVQFAPKVRIKIRWIRFFVLKVVYVNLPQKHDFYGGAKYLEPKTLLEDVFGWHAIWLS